MYEFDEIKLEFKFIFTYPTWGLVGSTSSWNFMKFTMQKELNHVKPYMYQWMYQFDEIKLELNLVSTYAIWELIDSTNPWNLMK